MLQVIARGNDVFDAVVVGSGATGGWAAKELTEAGLKPWQAWILAPYNAWYHWEHHRYPKTLMPNVDLSCDNYCPRRFCKAMAKQRPAKPAVIKPKAVKVKSVMGKRQDCCR